MPNDPYVLEHAANEMMDVYNKVVRNYPELAALIEAKAIEYRALAVAIRSTSPLPHLTNPESPAT